MKWLLGAGVVFLCLLMAGTIAFALRCSDVRGRFQPSTRTTAGDGIRGYARPEDDTFLTYAEWYIVWSYQEKAMWQEGHSPSGFPYLGAIEQYWSGYCRSYSVVHGRYPFNFGDHLMLVVIGTSFTVEYGLKGAYENSVGRLTEWISGHGVTDEDRYAAHVAWEYGAFVQDRPFYEFPFFSAFHRLWRETPLLGPHVLRKWERRAWLSLDYGIEGIYCGLIELASHATYGIEENVTYALIENASDAILSGVPGVGKVKSVGAESFIVKMPRYQKFTDSAQELLREKARFVEVAGNRQIMVTAIVPQNWTFRLPTGELLFSDEILTNPQMKRVVLRLPVSDLSVVAKLSVEHIYDY